MGDITGTADTSSSSGSLEHVSTIVTVAVVLILFLIILTVFFIGIYARWFWRRRAAHDETHNPRSRHGRFVFNFTPTQDLLVSDRKGLEPSLLHDLPVLIFHADNFDQGLECAVCLCELEDGEKARLLPGCAHGFHVDCIDMWFQSHSTCPVCRSTVGESNTRYQSLQGHLRSGYSTELRNLQANISAVENSRSRAAGLEKRPEASSSTSSSGLHNVSNASLEGSLVIEIPCRRPTDGFNSFSCSTPVASKLAEDEMKSPVLTRLRSIGRLLIREKRVVPCSPGLVDVEQGGGGRGQSSQTSSETSS